MSDDYTVINREIIIDSPIDKVFSAVSHQDELINRLVSIYRCIGKEGRRADIFWILEIRQEQS
jgi:hypothetical protein